MKKLFLPFLLVCFVSQAVCWSLSESFSTIGSSVASFCAKKPFITTAVSFVAGSCVTAGIIWLASKLKRKKQQEIIIQTCPQEISLHMCYEYPQETEADVTNYDLLCAVHFVSQQVQEVRDKSRLNISIEKSE